MSLLSDTFQDNETFDEEFFDTEAIKPVEKEIVVPGGKIINPLFVPMTGGPVKKLPPKELYSHYKRVLILTKKRDIKNLDIDTLLSNFVDKSVFLKAIKSLAVEITHMSLLKNYNHCNQAVILERNFLKMIDSTIQYENDEIVIPMFEINDEMVKIYKLGYSNTTDFTNFIRLKQLQDYFNAPKRYTSVGTSDLIQKLEGSEYWLKSFNCSLNMTDNFKKRTFSYRPVSKNVQASIVSKNSGLKNDHAKAVIQRLTNSKFTNNYLENIYRKEVYTDASAASRNNKYTFYRVYDGSSTLDTKFITNLFQLVESQKERYDLFNSLLLSKEHCHFVLNNKSVLELMKPMFDKFMPIYKYLFGYGWLCLYMEECIHKTRTTIDKRYVFDIDTANKLPFFPYTHEDIHMNPYCPLLVNKNTINSPENCHGVSMIADYKDYGIDTLENFRRKINIFSTGKPDTSVFDGLEKDKDGKWKHFAISGSIIPGCCVKRNPLMDILVDPSQLTFEEQYSRFFNEYNPDSDIDVMCNLESIFDFLDQVNNLYDTVKVNINKVVGKDVSDTFTIEPTKTLMIIVHPKFIEECMDEYDKEDVVKNVTKNEFKEFFYEKYITSKLKNNRGQRKTLKNKNPLYESFFKLSSPDDINLMITTYDSNEGNYRNLDSEYYLFLNDVVEKKVSADQNTVLLKISENLKFKIKSPHLPHSIEVFRTKYKDYFSCVSRFHLPCVRGFYDGGNVYLLPSCVSALMTFTNIDYKYFAGVRDPIDIINKYRSRGFGTIINDKEKLHMVEYNGSVPTWQKLTGVDVKRQTTIKNHLGGRMLGDNMFKPGVLKGIPNDAYLNPAKNYISTVDQLYGWYKENCKYDGKNSTVDFLKLKTVGEDGSVKPLKRWILEAGYDILS